MDRNPTRQRLNRAQYNLQSMRVNQANEEAFRHELENFLSAAREVTFIMQKQYEHVEGFPSWYEKQQGTTLAGDLFKRMNKLRTDSVHKKPPRMGTTRGLDLPSSFVLRTEDGTLADSALDGALAGKQTMLERWFFLEFPDRDALAVCEEHVKNLEALVDECEGAFLEQWRERSEGVPLVPN